MISEKVDNSSQDLSVMKKTSIFVSVVIPTYNYDVNDLVNDLSKTEHANYEIIVVDDCSTKEIKIKESVRYIKHEKNMGAGYARNTGGRIAQGNIILFLDSDVCLRNPDMPLEKPVDIIKAHAEIYDSNEVVGILGLLLWFNKNTIGNMFLKTPCAWIFSWPKYYSQVLWGPTANFSVRKDIFQKTSGFDDVFPKKGGGEDVDFGLRINKFGIIKTINIPVYHPSPIKLKKEIIDRIFRWGRGEFFLMKKHPSRTIWKLPYFLISCISLFIYSLVMGNINNIGFVKSFFVTLLCLLSMGITVKLIHILSIWIQDSIKQENEKQSFEKTSIIQLIGARILMMIYNSGKNFQAIIKGRFFYLFKYFIFFDEQNENALHDNKVHFFSNSIIFISTVIASIILLIFIK